MSVYLVRHINTETNYYHFMVAVAPNLRRLWFVVDEVIDPNVCDYTNIDRDQGLIAIDAEIVEVSDPGVDDLKYEAESYRVDPTCLLSSTVHSLDKRNWRPLSKHFPYNKK